MGSAEPVTGVQVRLVLIRHGEVDANRSFRYLGRRDDPLNETGRRQARALAEAAAGLPLDGVLTSPLRRARETADAIGQSAGVSVATEPRLIELDFGSWEGRTRAEVVRGCEADRIEVERWEGDPAAPTPGGESLVDVQRRSAGLADELARDRSGETIALVSHMGPIKTLLCAALTLPLTAARRIFLDPATVSVVDWGDRTVVRLVNSHGHLGFDGARWLDQA
jgi:broad specificity phosphatase PhoE